MNIFNKVSIDEYKLSAVAGLDKNDEISNENILNEYNAICLPQRGTKNSAGYDFFAPFSFILIPGESIVIPTGIRVVLEPDKFLAIFPRSGLGFLHRLQLDNTVGIIDSDYYFSDNEGHIYIKLRNCGESSLEIEQGEAFAQGIIMKFYSAENGESTTVRNGGLGSTNLGRGVL